MAAIGSLALSNRADARCGQGGHGGVSGGRAVSSTLATGVSPAFVLGSRRDSSGELDCQQAVGMQRQQQMLAMQQQLAIQQMQLLAWRQQFSQPLAQQLREQQELVSARKAVARQQRKERAARVASLKDKRAKPQVAVAGEAGVKLASVSRVQ